MKKALSASRASKVGLLALFCSTVASAQGARDITLIPVVAADPETNISERLFLRGVLSRHNRSALMVGEEPARIEVTPEQLSNADLITCPTNLAGLTDGWDMFSYSLDRNAAANLNLYAAASLSAGDRIVLYQWMWYKDVLNPSGRLIGRCGSGISLALRVRNLAANASVSLPFLAASAQLNQAEVEYRLTTFGVSGTAINDAIPTASKVGEFNAQSYAELLSTIDRVQAVGRAGVNVTFTPRVVALAAEVPHASLSRQVLTQAFALRRIQEGDRCTRAKERVPGRDAATDGLVEDVYRYVVAARACADNVEPAGPIRTRARDDLRAFGFND